MPSNGYLALSFGGTHQSKTDMIVFATSTNPSTNQVFDMYSTTYGEPIADDDNFDLSFIASTISDYPLVYFTATRDLDTSSDQDYTL